MNKKLVIASIVTVIVILTIWGFAKFLEPMNVIVTKSYVGSEDEITSLIYEGTVKATHQVVRGDLYTTIDVDFGKFNEEIDHYYFGYNGTVHVGDHVRYTKYVKADICERVLTFGNGTRLQGTDDDKIYQTLLNNERFNIDDSKFWEQQKECYFINSEYVDEKIEIMKGDSIATKCYNGLPCGGGGKWLVGAGGGGGN